MSVLQYIYKIKYFLNYILVEYTHESINKKKFQVYKFIESLKETDIFTITDIKIPNAKRTTIYYALNDALNEEKIERLSRGKYYIPKKNKIWQYKAKRFRCNRTCNKRSLQKKRK